MLQATPVLRWQLGNVGFHPLMGAVRLASGVMAQPSVSTGFLKGPIDSAAAAIDREIEALIVELDLASPTAVRVDPASPREISKIGNLPPQEIRAAISTAARELSNRIDRVIGGVLKTYMTADQKSVFMSLKTRADSIISAVMNQDVLNIPPQDEGMVHDYLLMHLSDPDQAILSAEKSVVEAEAGSVPVLEPGENGISKNIAIGVGLVTVTGLILWSVFG